MDPLKLPSESQLGPLGRRVLEVLGRYTAFPWPILSAQCKRANIDPTTLKREELKIIVPMLADGVRRFTSPQKGEQVKTELLALAV